MYPIMVRCRDWGDKELRFQSPQTMSVTSELHIRDNHTDLVGCP